MFDVHAFCISFGAACEVFSHPVSVGNLVGGLEGGSADDRGDGWEVQAVGACGG